MKIKTKVFFTQKIKVQRKTKHLGKQATWDIEEMQSWCLN